MLSAAMLGTCLALASIVVPPPVGADPVSSATGPESLGRTVEALGLALGVKIDAGPAIEDARLSPAVAGHLAALASAALDCHAAAAPARTALVQGGPSGGPTGASDALRSCATRLESLASQTSRFLTAAPVGASGLDLWPVLRYSPGSTADRYVHDYAVIVDQGGDDVYANNAGGSTLDLLRGPDGSPAPRKEPARGCHFAFDPLDRPGECFLGTAVLVDASGDDTYGIMEAPDPALDGYCTADPIVRRLFLEGAGVAGAGVLVDGAGNDRYFGRTNAQGAAQPGGVGILRDEGGDDSYLAIRSAQGYALGGVGLLRDDVGNDSYGFYAPRPLDPNAPFQRPGSGGVMDDVGNCDSLTRQLQGTGIFGGFGALIDLGGQDHYRAGPPALQAFGLLTLMHGSQGYGALGGTGLLRDEAGHDSYEGVPDRADGVVIHPGPSSTGWFEDSDPSDTKGRS